MSATGMKEGKRKLAAIMFTDIVRYSAISHDNEALALALLEEHRALTRPLLREFSGEEVKTIGDAFLVTFESALDAARCAIEIQKAHRERNAKEPEGRAIRLRIGIHLGDVIRSEGDVYGDGVNIAARLQYVARPDGICISGSVFYQINNKLGLPIISIGTRTLKNIEGPIALYVIQSQDEVRAWKSRPWYARVLRGLTRLARSRKRMWVPVGVSVAAVLSALAWAPLLQQPGNANPGEALRLAVLPFHGINLLTGDEYISDGMTEELISNLSRVRNLRVLARSSVMRYKDSPKSLQEIGRELEVSSLIQGTVRKDGEKLRISVQFIDAKTQESRWSRDYDGRADDLFRFQASIAGEVASRFRGRSLAHARGAAVPKGEAYEHYLKGRFFMNKRTEEGLQRAVAEFQQALVHDSSFAPLHAALAMASDLQAYYGHVPSVEAAGKVRMYTDKALALDGGSPEALLALAEIKAYFDFDAQGADETFQRIFESNPSYSTAHQWYAEYLVYRGQKQKAVDSIEQALKLDPMSLVVKSAAAKIHYFSRRFDDSMRYSKAIIDMDPGFMLGQFWFGRAALQAGLTAEAIGALERASELSSGSSMMKAALAHAYAVAGRQADAEKILQELLERSQRRYVSPYDIGQVYAGMGRGKEAIPYLEKAVQERASQLPMIKVDPALKKLWDTPEYIDLLKRVPF